MGVFLKGNKAQNIILSSRHLQLEDKSDLSGFGKLKEKQRHLLIFTSVCQGAQNDSVIEVFCLMHWNIFHLDMRNQNPEEITLLCGIMLSRKEGKNKQ